MLMSLPAVEPVVGAEPQPRRRAERAAFQPEDLHAVGVVAPLSVVLQPA